MRSITGPHLNADALTSEAAQAEKVRSRTVAAGHDHVQMDGKVRYAIGRRRD